MAPPAHAGPAPAVSVTFAGVDQYVGAGHSADEVRRTLERLEHCLRRLGARSLQEGQHLRIEVTHLAMAGVPGGPRIELRYLLQAPDGQVVLARQAALADAPAEAVGQDRADAEPLPRERQLLARWFEQAIGAPLRPETPDPSPSDRLDP